MPYCIMRTFYHCSTKIDHVQNHVNTFLYMGFQ
nr:MAG TPA: hypothetical protein [Bacteriophage sp.]